MIDIQHKIGDFYKGEKVYYTYRGYGPKWIYYSNAEVVKENRITVKIKILYSGEYLTFNVHPLELRKLN